MAYEIRKINGEEILFKNAEKFSGLYKEYYINGNLRCEINYKFGKKEGLYKEYNDYGLLLSEINYIAGKKEGVYKNYYVKGGLAVKANYKNDKLEGFCKVFQNKNLEKEGFSLKGNLLSSMQIYREYSKVTGAVKCEGIYGEKNKKEGIWIKYNNEYYWENKEEYELIPDRTFDELNMECIVEENYKNGNLYGMQKIYYDNGKIKKLLYYEKGLEFVEIYYPIHKLIIFNKRE